MDEVNPNSSQMPNNTNNSINLNDTTGSKDPNTRESHRLVVIVVTVLLLIGFLTISSIAMGYFGFMIKDTEPNTIKNNPIVKNDGLDEFTFQTIFSTPLAISIRIPTDWTYEEDTKEETPTTQAGARIKFLDGTNIILDIQNLTNEICENGTIENLQIDGIPAKLTKCQSIDSLVSSYALTITDPTLNDWNGITAFASFNNEDEKLIRTVLESIDIGPEVVGKKVYKSEELKFTLTIPEDWASKKESITPDPSIPIAWATPNSYINVMFSNKGEEVLRVNAYMGGRGFCEGASEIMNPDTYKEYSVKTEVTPIDIANGKYALISECLKKDNVDEFIMMIIDDNFSGSSAKPEKESKDEWIGLEFQGGGLNTKEFNELKDIFKSLRFINTVKSYITPTFWPNTDDLALAYQAKSQLVNLTLPVQEGWKFQESYLKKHAYSNNSENEGSYLLNVFTLEGSNVIRVTSSSKYTTCKDEPEDSVNKGTVTINGKSRTYNECFVNGTSANTYFIELDDFLQWDKGAVILYTQYAGLNELLDLVKGLRY